MKKVVIVFLTLFACSISVIGCSTKVFSFANGLDYMNLEPIVFGSKKDIFFLLDGELCKLLVDSYVYVDFDGCHSFVALFSNNDYIYGITLQEIYEFDSNYKIHKKFFLPDMLGLNDFHIINSCFLDNTIYLDTDVVNNDNNALFVALNTNKASITTYYFREYLNTILYIDGHYFSTYGGFKLYEGDNVYKPYNIVHDKKNDIIDITFYDGSKKSCSIGPSVEKLYQFGAMKTFSSKTYFALSQPNYNDGCRVSTSELMMFRGDRYDFKPCEHSIGKTFLYSYDKIENKIDFIKELKFGAFVFDIDFDLNVTYYAENKIFRNNNVISVLDYDTFHGTYANTWSIGWDYFPPSDDDYSSIKSFGCINSLPICFCQILK